MNKRNIKKFFIIIGTILLLLDFGICFIDSGDIFEALITMALETFIEFGELESILSILGMTFILFGLIIKEENIPHTTENNKKSIVKYNVLRVIGFIPFIGVLCFGIYSAIVGFGFVSSYSKGIEGFLSSIFIISFFVWPLYIIGAVIIIKSSSKIKSFKNNKMKNTTEKDRNIYI